MSRIIFRATAKDHAKFIGIHSVRLSITKDCNCGVEVSSGQFALDKHFRLCCCRNLRAER
jgi:hypothetical protein